MKNRNKYLRNRVAELERAMREIEQLSDCHKRFKNSTAMLAITIQRFGKIAENALKEK